MIVHYYIAPKQAVGRIATHAHHWSWAEIDDENVILWARFADTGSEFNFRQVTGVDALEHAGNNRIIAGRHAQMLSRFGVQEHHTTLDVSDCLEKAIGHCMRLPMY